MKWITIACHHSLATTFWCLYTDLSAAQRMARVDLPSEASIMNQHDDEMNATPAAGSVTARWLLPCERPVHTKQSQMASVVRHILTVFGLLFLTHVDAVRAQPPGPADPPTAVQREDVQRLFTDRQVTTALQGMREALDRNDPESAARHAARLRLADSRLMVPSRANPQVFEALHRAFESEWRRMPDRYRAGFRQTSEQTADQKLRDVMSQGQIRGLVELAHRFAGTESATRARRMIAQQHMARGELRAARWWLQDPARSSTKGQSPANDVDRSDRTKPKSDANSSSEADIPTNLQWNYQPMVSPELEGQIRGLVQICVEADVIPRSTWTAHVDGDTIYRRTMRGIAAVDSANGIPRWHYRLFPNPDTNLREQSGGRGLFDISSQRFSENLTEERFSLLDNSMLANVFCRDGIQSGLSADDQRIYLVAEGTEVAGSVSRFRLNRSSISAGMFRGSQLIALEKSSGRRIWSVGGHVQDRPLGTELANAWFAGPPVAQSGKLWCVIEQNGEVRLATLQPHTGELIWNVTLAFPQQSIDKDPARRLWSATPAADQGLIWCPTTTGWLVAVDSLTRSVLWASRMDLSQPADDLQPVSRGRQYINTDAQSLPTQWGPHPTTIADDRIICFPQEYHQACIFDATSGELLHHLDARPAAIPIHIDDRQLVLADSTAVECFSLESGRPLWKRELTATDGMPTGQAVKRDNYLLTLMSNGNITAFDLADGSVHNSQSVPLSNPSWGYLIEDENGDIIRMAPDRLLRLSMTTPANETRNPLELADAYYQADDWAKALRILQQIPEHDQHSNKYRNLLFACHLRQALLNSSQPLEVVQQLAETLEQKLLVKVLTARRFLDRSDDTGAGSQLLEILQQEQSLLTTTVPIPFLTAEYHGNPRVNDTSRGSTPTRASEESNPGRVQVHTPVGTWAAAELSSLLNRSPQNTSSSLDSGHNSMQLQTLPDSILMQIDSPAILDSLLNRVESTDSAETSLHLLLHGLQVLQSSLTNTSADYESRRRQVISRLQDLIHSREDLASNTPANDPSVQLAIHRILDCIAIELADTYDQPDLLHGPSDAASGNSSGTGLIGRQLLDSNFRDRIRSQWDEWKLQPYQMLPFAQPTSFVRMSVELTTAIHDDPFLRQYRWSVLREPTRLHAASVTDPKNDAWSLPGSLTTRSGYAGSTDAITRVGSILLIRSPERISAVSVIDRRVLWSRRIDRFSHVHRDAESDTGNFHNFDARQTPLPGDATGSNCRIIGYGYRWLAVMSNYRIEVLDLLNGYSLWNATSESGWGNAAATDSLIVALPIEDSPTPDSEPFTFRRQDGSRTQAALNTAQVEAAIVGIDSLIVTIRKSIGGPDDARSRLLWIDPSTGNIEREVSLGAASHFQFPDDGTIVGFTDSETFRMVNFRSAEFVDGDYSRTDRQNVSDSRVDVWSPNRVSLSTDLLHCFVTRPGDEPLPLGIHPISRRLSVLGREVRAIRKESGQLAWHFINDSSALAATDQPYLPLLIVFGVGDEPANAAGETVQQNRFQGVIKSTGDKLFDEIVPSRFALRSVWLETDRNRTVDIEVFGNRVRIEPIPVTVP